MRRWLRGSLTVLLLGALVLVAGCGGSEVPADEVPGAPVTLTVPSDEDIGGGASSGAGTDANAGADADTSAQTDADTADPAATAEPVAPTTTDDTSGGAVAPATDTTPDDTAADDQAPVAPETQQFEDFCEQNAGAC